jgi:hypothetical protein
MLVRLAVHMLAHWNGSYVLHLRVIKIYRGPGFLAVV